MCLLCTLYQTRRGFIDWYAFLQTQQLCQSHKPSVQVSSSAVSIGRAHVPRHTKLTPRFEILVC